MKLKEVLKTLIRKFQDHGIDFALSGGLALSTMGLFRFTRDIDSLIHEQSRVEVDAIMVELGYERQGFSRVSRTTSFKSSQSTVSSIHSRVIVSSRVRCACKKASRLG